VDSGPIPVDSCRNGGGHCKVLALIGNGFRCFRGFRTSTHIGITVVGKEDVDRTILTK